MYRVEEKNIINVSLLFSVLLISVLLEIINELANASIDKLS